jgi:uncharacterized protein with HEPN domain
VSSREWLLLVRDILNAIDSIQQRTTGMTEIEFEENETVVKAVLYDLMVIGEAAVNIPAEIRASIPELPWRLMSDMRNLITHKYFRVEPEIVWDTVQNNLPELVQPLQKLLQDNFLDRQQ